MAPTQLPTSFLMHRIVSLARWEGTPGRPAQSPLAPPFRWSCARRPSRTSPRLVTERSRWRSVGRECALCPRCLPLPHPSLPHTLSPPPPPFTSSPASAHPLSCLSCASPPSSFPSCTLYPSLGPNGPACLAVRPSSSRSFPSPPGRSACPLPHLPRSRPALPAPFLSSLPVAPLVPTLWRKLIPATPPLTPHLPFLAPFPSLPPPPPASQVAAAHPQHPVHPCSPPLPLSHISRRHRPAGTTSPRR